MLTEQPIYAGDTPLACTLAVVQTGPLQLTVRAGSFTTTGEAQILADAAPAVAAGLVTADLAQWLPDGRLRVWLPGPDGQPLARSTTYTLPADVVFTLTADPTSAKTYRLEFGLAQGTPDVLCRSQLAGEALPDPPPGWTPLHWLAGPFVLPPGATRLDAVAIPVFTVLPAFPAGTTGADWQLQRGGG